MRSFFALFSALGFVGVVRLFLAMCVKRIDDRWERRFPVGR